MHGMTESTQSLYNATRGHIAAIDRQTNEINKVAEEIGCPPELLKNQDGSFALTPLLSAKAHCLQALALLKSQEKKR